EREYRGLDRIGSWLPFLDAAIGRRGEGQWASVAEGITQCILAALGRKGQRYDNPFREPWPDSGSFATPPRRLPRSMELPVQQTDCNPRCRCPEPCGERESPRALRDPSLRGREWNDTPHSRPYHLTPVSRHIELLVLPDR